MASRLFKAALRLHYLTEEQLEKAEAYRAETGVSEAAALRDSKLMTEEKMLELYAALYGYPTEAEPEQPEDSLANNFTYTELYQIGFYPCRENGQIKILTTKPSELLYAEDMIRDKLGYRGGFCYVLITETALQRLLASAFQENATADTLGAVETEGVEGADEPIYDITESDSSGIVNLVNKIFREAVEKKVSDVHFEPQPEGFMVRFREDGSLHYVYKLPLAVTRPVTNRIKTMSNLDVNSSKIIQDGNCRLDTFGGRVVDLRVSVIPAACGENLVVRILDQNKMNLDISALGFSAANEKTFLKMIRRPRGIILMTGPTGSGKSTSLYAALSVLNTPDRCIITFEDPCEYRIPGIVQVQMNPAMGVTFPQALKSGMRQDIEVALVGEIRDSETAHIAFDAANTGHLVLSTLHTNSAASSVVRLTQMGVEPFMIASTLIAVINQRLVKRICPYCKEAYELEADSPYRKVLDCGSRPVTVYRGRGCSKCGGEGYKGRVAVQEFLVINENIGKLLERGAATHEIEAAAIAEGMQTICQDGIQKALEGITTLDAVHRTVFFDNL